MKISIKFDDEGIPISDKEAFSLLEKIVSKKKNGDKEFSLHICNEIAVLPIRVLIKEGKISHKDVTFVAYGEIIPFDKNGITPSPEPESLNIHLDLLVRLI